MSSIVGGVAGGVMGAGTNSNDSHGVRVIVLRV